MKTTKTAYVPKAHKVGLMKQFCIWLCGELCKTTTGDGVTYQKGKFIVFFYDIDFDDEGMPIAGRESEVSISLVCGLCRIIKFDIKSMWLKIKNFILYY